MPKMIKISAAEYERLQDCIREDGMRIAALIEENKALHQDVRRLTAVEVAPVVHGRWISWAEADNHIPSLNRHECSICHDAAQVLVSGFEMLSFYCPNCGAKMDGEGNAE